MHFWEMTLREVQLAIKGKQEKIKVDMRISAMIAFNQSQHLASLIASLFDKKNKPLTLNEAFPGIFPDEVVKPRQQDWRVMKARMEQFAQAKKAWEVNKRGNDNR